MPEISSRRPGAFRGANCQHRAGSEVEAALSAPGTAARRRRRSAAAASAPCAPGLGSKGSSCGHSWGRCHRRDGGQGDPWSPAFGTSRRYRWQEGWDQTVNVCPQGAARHWHSSARGVLEPPALGAFNRLQTGHGSVVASAALGSPLDFMASKLSASLPVLPALEGRSAVPARAEPVAFC